MPLGGTAPPHEHTKVSRDVDISRIPVNRDIGDWLVAEAASRWFAAGQIARPRRAVSRRVIGDFEYVPRRCAGGHRVSVIAGIGDERVVRVRRINRNTADKTCRLRCSINSKEGDRTWG